MELWLIRHGQSQGNVDLTFGDLPPTELGQNQQEHVGPWPSPTIA